MAAFFTAKITPGPLQVGADNIVELTELTRTDDGSEVNSGVTAEFQVTDSAGNVVQSSTPMTPSGAGGIWTGDMPNPPDTLALRAGESYIVAVTVVLDTTFEQTIFTVGKSAADGVGFYNWFGSFPAKVVALYPGAVLDDFGAGDPQTDQHSIANALTSAATRVLAAAPPRVYAVLHRVEAELIEGNASAAQATVVVSLPGVIDASLLLFKNYGGCPKSPVPTDAIPAADFTVARVTDPTDADYRKLRVTFVGGKLLALGDTIHATYDLNPNDDNYQFVDLADLTTKIAAAEVGGRLYRTNATTWSLVEQYQEEAEKRLDELRNSLFVPTAVRSMTLCEDIETAAGEQVESVRWARET